MIHVIATSANIVENYDKRKEQYIQGLTSIVQHYKINPYIIECVNPTDYLNEHYVGRNDDIIKTTLRYTVVGPKLVDEINQNTHDVYCKYSDDLYPWSGKSGVHVFLISMKYKCWKDFLSKMNRNVSDDHPVEHQFAQYVATQNTKYLDSLSMIARPIGLGREEYV